MALMVGARVYFNLQILDLQNLDDAPYTVEYVRIRILSIYLLIDFISFTLNANTHTHAVNCI